MSEVFGRKPYEKAASIEQRALDIATNHITELGTPVALAMPQFETVVDMSYATGNRIPRSSLKRIWPTNDSMNRAITKHLLENDPYKSNEIADRSQTIIRTALGALATGEYNGKLPSLKQDVIANIGRVLIDGSDHVVASRIETTVASHPDYEELRGTLAETRGRYIGTISASLQEAHGELDDLPSYETAYEDYAESAAALARSIALNPIPAIREQHDLHAKQFQTLGDYYTR